MAPADAAPPGTLRIDRWLWYARFFKTRSVAADAVKSGQVRVNDQRVKPAREVKVGDRLAITRAEVDYELTIAALPVRRGPAAEASLCYVESEESIEARRLAAEQRTLNRDLIRAPTPGRPDKRTRRLLREKRHISDERD
jgi:ribosome-associated heat shock protein Hsp15